MPCLSHYRLTDKVVLWNSAALRRKLRDRHARDHNTIGIYGYHLRLLGKSSQRTCVRASLSKFDCFIICLILVYIFWMVARIFSHLGMIWTAGNTWDQSKDFFSASSYWSRYLSSQVPTLSPSTTITSWHDNLWMRLKALSGHSLTWKPLSNPPYCTSFLLLSSQQQW